MVNVNSGGGLGGAAEGLVSGLSIGSRIRERLATAKNNRERNKIASQNNIALQGLGQQRIDVTAQNNAATQTLGQQRQNETETQNALNRVQSNIDNLSTALKDTATIPESRSAAGDKLAIQLGTQLFKSLERRASLTGEPFNPADAQVMIDALRSGPTNAEKNAIEAAKIKSGITATADANLVSASKVGEAQGITKLNESGVTGVPLEKQTLFNIVGPNGTRTVSNTPQGVTASLQPNENAFPASSVQTNIPDLGLNKKEVSTFRAQETSARVSLNELDRLQQQVNDSENVTGFLSGPIRALDGAVNSLVQASKTFTGQDDVTRGLLESGNFNFGKFGNIASKSAAFKSNITNLAYALARAAEPGARSLTNQDIQTQLNRLGGNSGDKNQILASLKEVDRTLKESLKISFDVLNRASNGQLGDFPQDLLFKGKTSSSPSQGNIVTDNQGNKVSVIRLPDGTFDLQSVK